MPKPRARWFMLLCIISCGGAGTEPSTASSSSGGSGSSSGSAGPPADLGAPKAGVATFYDANGTGNCGFDASPKDLMVVALNKQRYWEGSALCGACLNVAGPKGSVVVRVVDSCPVDTPEVDCGDSGADLDLSKEAFEKVGTPKNGRESVTFQMVPCQVAGNMEYRFKEGSSQYWTAIQLRNHRLPVSKLEYKKNGAWTDMPRVDYNYFIDPKGVGVQPQGLSLRITSRDGKVLEDQVPAVLDGKSATGSKQF
jgi:expansin (peptidoglycan-binding protein)